MKRLILYLYAYLRSALRVVLLIACALFLPRFFMMHISPVEQEPSADYADQTLIDSSADAYYRDSFLGLLAEVEPFDVGTGSCVLLPAQQQVSKNVWHELRIRLKRQGVESVGYSYYNTEKKQQCAGLKLLLSEESDFSSFKTLLVVLQFFKKAGVQLKFSDQFDVAIGNSSVRRFIEGSIGKDEFERMAHQRVITFFKQARNNSRT